MQTDMLLAHYHANSLMLMAHDALYILYILYYYVIYINILYLDLIV